MGVTRLGLRPPVGLSFHLSLGMGLYIKGIS